jgi:hypothetical protein
MFKTMENSQEKKAADSYFELPGEGKRFFKLKQENESSSDDAVKRVIEQLLHNFKK